MKYALAVLLTVAAQAAVVYNRPPVGVNGGGSASIDFFDGIPIQQQWSVRFGGSDGFVSVLVDARGRDGTLGTAVPLGVSLLESRGWIFDTNGNLYSGYAEYGLGDQSSPGKVTVYEFNGGSPFDPNSFTALATVPIWGQYTFNLLQTIPEGRHETRQYEVLIYTPEPKAAHLFGMGGLTLLAMHRYGRQMLNSWRSRLP